MTVPYTIVTTDAPEPEFQLTVVTVCWNALADLKPTVESVLRQKAKGSISIEHVVVDGASTDGTPEWLAEQLAAGNIERYVSEPDRGIYDAMNKGINLARGRVLAFLNAGDWYADDVDLAECVHPICNGETQAVAACARLIDSRFGNTQRPSYGQLYFFTPCCHQAFFASAALYRELGGYDTTLKCSADADVMYRMYNSVGEPAISGLYVVNFGGGGLSSKGDDDFRDENVENLWRNWENIAERCRREPDFLMAMEGFLLYHCQQFHDWQERHGHPVPQTLEKLRKMCVSLSGSAHSLFAKTALRFMAHAYLPSRIKGLPCSKAMRKLLKFWLHAGYMPDGNKYKDTVWLPNRPLSSNPWFRFLR